MKCVSLERFYAIADRIYKIEELVKKEKLADKSKPASDKVSEFLTTVKNQLGNNEVVISTVPLENTPFNADTMQAISVVEDSTLPRGESIVTAVDGPVMLDNTGTVKRVARVMVRRNSAVSEFNGTPEMIRLYNLATVSEQQSLIDAQASGTKTVQIKKMLNELGKTNPTIKTEISRMKFAKIMDNPGKHSDMELFNAIAFFNNVQPYPSKQIKEAIEKRLMVGQISDDILLAEVVDKILSLRGIVPVDILAKNIIAEINSKLPAVEANSIVDDINILAEKTGNGNELSMALFRLHNLSPDKRKYVAEFIEKANEQIFKNGVKAYTIVLDYSIELHKDVDESRHIISDKEILSNSNEYEGWSKVARIVSPRVLDQEGNVVKRAEVVVVRGTKKRVQTGDPINHNEIVKSITVNEIEYNLFGNEAIEGNLMGYTWMNVSLDGAERTADAMYKLKNEAMNATSNSNITFTLKVGDILGNVANQTNPLIHTPEALELHNGGKDILYIEASIKKRNKTHTFVYTVFPTKGALEKAMKASKNPGKTAEMIENLRKLYSAAKSNPDGLDVTAEMKPSTSRKVTKGRLFYLKPRYKYDVGYKKSLQEVIDSMKENKDREMPPVKFSKEVFSFNDDLKKPDGTILAYAGDPVIFASQHRNANGDYTILDRYIKSIIDKNPSHPPEEVIVLKVDNRAMNLFEMIQLWKGKSGEKRLGVNDSRILIGDRQGERFHYALKHILPMMSSDKKATDMINQMLNDEFDNPYYSGKKSHLFNLDENKFKVYSGVLLHQLSVFSDNAEQRNTLTRIWAKMQEQGNTEIVLMNGKKATSGFQHGIMSNMRREDKLTLVENPTGKELPIMVMKKMEDQRIDVMKDLLVTNLESVGAPSAIIVKSAVQSILKKAELNTKVEQKKVITPDENSMKELESLRNRVILGDTKQMLAGYSLLLQDMERLQDDWKSKITNSTILKQFVDATNKAIKDTNKMVDDLKNKLREDAFNDDGNVQILIPKLKQKLKDLIDPDYHNTVDAFSDIDRLSDLMDHLLSLEDTAPLDAYIEIEEELKKKKSCEI